MNYKDKLIQCNDVPQIRLISIFLEAEPKRVWYSEVQIQKFSRLSAIVDRPEKRSTRIGDSKKSLQTITPTTFYLTKDVYLNSSESNYKIFPSDKTQHFRTFLQATISSLEHHLQVTISWLLFGLFKYFSQGGRELECQIKPSVIGRLKNNCEDRSI